MNQRSMELWLPGLITLTGSMLALRLLQSLPWMPSPSILRFGPPIIPYAFWLLTLPLFGALGAFLAKRNGANTRTCLLSGIFPALAMLATLSLAFIFAMAIERNPFILQHPIYLAAAVLPWTLFPAAALALGSLPFLAPREAAFTP